MDKTSIIGDLVIPYLCITAKMSSQECLLVHEDFLERMRIMDEEIEKENKCIDEIVTNIKTSVTVDFSKLSIDSIMKDFRIVTGSILERRPPVLMNNTVKLLDECFCYMKKVVPSILNMSTEVWSGYREKVCRTVENLELWSIAYLKIYEQDYELKLFLDATVFEACYHEIYNSYRYFNYLERTLDFNNPSTDKIKLHSIFIAEFESFIETPYMRDFVNKLEKFKDLKELIRYSRTDECPICLDRLFTSPETRFIINGNPDCRHIICSYCMYNCVYIVGVNARLVDTMI